MKKKLLAVLSLVLVACTAMLFTACGGSEVSVYKQAEKKVVYTDAGSEAISNIDGYTLVLDYQTGEAIKSKSFVAFEKAISPETAVDYTATTWSETRGSKTIIYNVEKNKSISIADSTVTVAWNGTKTASSNYKFVEFKLFDEFVAVTESVFEDITDENNLPTNNFFMANQAKLKTSKVTLTIYNADLESIATKECDKEFTLNGISEIVNSNKTIGFTIEDDFYRIKDGAVASIVEDYINCELSVSSIATCTVRGDYAYLKGNTTLKVYDLGTLELVNRFNLPADYMYSSSFYFNDGVLIQGEYVADQYSDDYDYQAVEIDEERALIVKLKVETKFYGVNGDVKDIDTNYFLSGVKYATDDENYIFDDYQAIIYSNSKFEDKRDIVIDQVAFAINDDCELVEIEEVIDNQQMNTLIEKFDNGNYIVKDREGISYLYNEDGEQLAAKKLSNKVGNYYKVDDKYINPETFEEYKLPENYNFYGEKNGEIIIYKTENDLANPGTGNGTYSQTTYARFVDGAAKVLYVVKLGYIPETTPTTSVVYATDYAYGYAEITTTLSDGKKTVKFFGWDGTLLETISDFNDNVPVKAISVGDYYVIEITVNTGAAAPAAQTKTVYYRLGA